MIFKVRPGVSIIVTWELFQAILKMPHSTLGTECVHLGPSCKSPLLKTTDQHGVFHNSLPYIQEIPEPELHLLFFSFIQIKNIA